MALLTSDEVYLIVENVSVTKVKHKFGENVVVIKAVLLINDKKCHLQMLRTARWQFETELLQY